jgi:hypothetical protein
MNTQLDIICVIRKDMDVNEHGRLENITLGRKFHGCSTLLI